MLASERPINYLYRMHSASDPVGFSREQLSKFAENHDTCHRRCNARERCSQTIILSMTISRSEPT